MARKLTIGGLELTVRELTVIEIRTWLSDPPVTDRPLDLVTDLLNFDGLAVEDLFRFCDLDRAAVDALTPSELAKLAAVVKETNRDFFTQYLPALTRLREAVPVTPPDPTPLVAPAAQPSAPADPSAPSIAASAP